MDISELSNKLICEKHFIPTDININNKQKLLNKNSVPVKYVEPIIRVQGTIKTYGRKRKTHVKENTENSSEEDEETLDILVHSSEAATLCSEVSTREYEERMEILSKIHTHWQKHEQVVVGTPIETYEIPNNYDEPDQQLANSENIIDAPVAHSQNDEQVVVSTSIENYEIPNNYDEPDQQLANSENIMNAPVETNEVQGNKDTQTQAQQLEKTNKMNCHIFYSISLLKI
ncbi:hypothetical protein FQA39_LY03342 [Lamprigera yunnana]|nr:hypothetical protein FQA39_LY03342 [Lamprigera yunnana]